MRLEIKKTFQTRSERVKGIDVHPTEPWVLATMYTGRVQIWNYETEAVVKTFEISDLPVRAGRFVARKNWVVVGSDDFQLRVFNYNTGEKVAQFEAHPDYIRSIAVHPSLPYVLSTADDMVIKLWNWEKGWSCQQSFEGHANYVMYLAFNPKDPNTFASACLDRTVKIWALNSSQANFTLEAHETRGVNFVEYYPQADKPYLITASDDRTIKVWDYQTKSAVATLEGHSANVSFAVFHPELPIIISGAEDSSIRIWNANTYKLEQSLNYGLERAWCVATRKGSNRVALGFDAGAVVLTLGKDEPTVSLDLNGRLVWTKNAEVYTHVFKAGADSEAFKDGQLMPLTPKELGSVEGLPTQLTHSPNGRFVAVVGDGEYVVYTALAWRVKAFGPALDFAWAPDSSDYAVLSANGDVRSFHNNAERPSGHFQTASITATQLFGGGALLGVGGGADEFVAFLDWDSGRLVRRVDVDATAVQWSQAGDLVAIITSDTLYVLRYNAEAFQEALANDTVDPEDGVEDAFEVVHELSESVRTGRWVGDCFVYTTVTNRLNYLVGGLSYTISHFDSQVYLLGYLARDNAVYVCDKDINVSAYRLSLGVIEYQTVVLRGDLEYAAELLDNVPESERTKVARFLESQGHSQLALDVTRDPEHKFELAIALDQLDVAKEIAEQEEAKSAKSGSGSTPESEQTSSNPDRWKSLGDKALAQWNVPLAQICYQRAADLESLLLIYTSTGNKSASKALAVHAAAQGKNNVAFNAHWYAGDVDACVTLLTKTGRAAEASLLAYTYGRDFTQSLSSWKAVLQRTGRGRIADSLGQPTVAASPVNEESLIDAE